ncbi:MAG: hypothetical protein MJY85_11870, partial [Fibrobacter sp.]|nr:hypothetical protein [Fibrobacter sp.]
MNKKIGLVGAALLTTAMIVACGDDSSSSNNDPVGPGPIAEESSSSSEVLIPNSSADEPIPGSSATVPESSSNTTIPGSSAVIPASSSSVPAAISSSSEAVANSSSSSNPVVESSSSEIALGPTEKTYAFGYALKNAPRPSKGCGKNSALVKTKSVENGDRFEMMVEGQNREYFITLPKNYDNTKPYKLLFAMHCMGSNAEDFVHHYADQDHPSPYYGQQKLDTEGNYIFVSPRGDTDGWPWSRNSDKDHKFFDKLLTTMEDNYC